MGSNGTQADAIVYGIRRMKQRLVCREFKRSFCSAGSGVCV